MTTNNNQTGWIFRDALIRLSPVEFAKFTERLSERLFREPDDKTARVFPFEVLEVNELESVVEICPRKQEFSDADSHPYATMTATHRPNGYSKVTMKADPVNFAGIAEYWEYLIDALRAESLIVEDTEAQDGAGKKKRNKPFETRAWVWRQISVQVKTRELIRPIDCIREIQSKPGERYKNFKMCPKTMSRVMREGLAGDYDNP
jgi:hypothetical protein